MKNCKGITLIALVVTIVVLLILAGTSIAMLSGENGIIRQAQYAKMQTVHTTVYEALLLEANNFKMDKTMEQNIAKTVIEHLQKKEMVTSVEDGYIVNVEKLCQSKLAYGNGTDGETDVYKLEEETTTSITEKEYSLKYYGKNDETPTHIGKIIDEVAESGNTSVEGNINFEFSPELNEYGWANADVTVIVNTDSQYTLKTSRDNENWTEAKELLYTETGIIYAKLVDNSGNEGQVEQREIKIDKTAPSLSMDAMKFTDAETGTDAREIDWYTIDEILTDGDFWGDVFVDRF